MTGWGGDVQMTCQDLIDPQCDNASRYIFPTYMALIYPFFHTFARVIRPYIIL